MTIDIIRPGVNNSLLVYAPCHISWHKRVNPTPKACPRNTGQLFDSYAATYEVLERDYADLCRSDDREYYRNEALDANTSAYLAANPADSRSNRLE